MNNTAISWTDRTWNPNSGCEIISEGCKYCYALALAERLRRTPAFPNGFDLTLREHKLKEPYRLKHPALIFVNSMSDLFWEQLSDEWRDRVLEVIEDTPQHQYQVLTKRPEEMLRYSKRRKLPPNFWAGVSIESARHVKRADLIRDIDVPIHFISVEPILDDVAMGLDLENIQWLISGGESGRHLFDADICARRGLVEYQNGIWKVREDRKDWVRDLCDLCEVHGTAFLHKQWGGATPKSAGRHLDGRIYNEFPEFKRRTG